MPNGGSDCCGTCWFNRKNKGEAGYDHARDPEPAHCEIRDLPIADPFYTYCANHPHRNPACIKTPIGPVYTGDSEGNREVWVECPDSEAIRIELLQLLKQIDAKPTTEYPLGLRLDEIVVRQLGVFRERRAIQDLKRIASLDPSVLDGIGVNRDSLVSAARWALRQLKSSRVEKRPPRDAS